MVDCSDVTSADHENDVTDNFVKFEKRRHVK